MGQLTALCSNVTKPSRGSKLAAIVGHDRLNELAESESDTGGDLHAESLHTKGDEEGEAAQDKRLHEMEM